MSTAAPPLTPDDLLRMGSAGKGYELVNGELRGTNVSTESSRVGVKVCTRLENHVEAMGLGWVFPADTGFRCFRDESGKVRKPDGAFISFATLPPDQYEPDGFCVTVPDLVVEVVSPNDLVDEKRDEWLSAGVKVVWIAYPRTRTIQVYQAGNRPLLLREPDNLTAPDLLPGFSTRVADIFRRPGEAPVQ
ncbi:Uma2 family endonuclease [bacterium]|nr:Uma2 family endonuclease [bacterium]